VTHDQFAEEVVATAIETIDSLPAGEEFKLRDLFPDELWGSFPKGARIAAGEIFKERAEAISSLQPLGRDAKNHQRYRKL
jgi:hypothetical protein